MSPVVAELEERIRALDADDRAELIRALIEEIDGPTPTSSAPGAKKHNGAIREILEGKVETVPGEQVFENLRARLRR